MCAGASLLFAWALVLQTPAQPAVALTVESTSQVYQLFLEARVLEGRDDLTGAIAAYQNALKIAPNAAEIHAELAGLYARQGKLDDALASAQQAINIDPSNREANRTLGFMQAELADASADPARVRSLVGEAIGHLEKATVDREVDPGAQFALGRLYLRAGRYTGAIEALRTFLLDEPGYPDGVLLLADAYDATGRLDEAIAELEALTAAQPSDVRVWESLADLYEEKHDWKSAAAIWTTLSAKNPRSTSYLTRRATALVNSGDVETGRRALLDATTMSPRDIGAWYLLSQVEHRAGNITAAEEAARRIIAIDPADPRGALASAEAKSARGDYRDAISVLSPIAAAARREDVSSGTYARVVDDLAAAMQQVGDRAGAVKVFEDARRVAPKDIDLALGLADAYQRDQRFDQAEQTVRDVIAGDPANAEALNRLGYLLADRGRKLDEAVSLIQRALTIEDGNPAFLDSLGWAYLKQSRLDLARDPLQRAAAARPRTSIIQEHLGELYFQLKLYREAADAWDRALSGDGAGIDAAAVARKRDRAKELAGRE